MLLELFGLARVRAGRPRLEVNAHTLGEALAALERLCPDLPAAHLLVSLNGERFISDPSQRLTPTDTLVILNAESGG